jgi:predicted unusual protein kinase regulating ubiquinone biosynthesis (AarF/ABC1/UbiB family)
MLYKVIDIFIYVKYFMYFIFLINSLFFNYVFYKRFSNPNKFLLKNLYFNINLNGAFAIKLVQWTITQFQFIEDSNSFNKYILNLFSNFYENNYIHNINYTLSILNNNLAFNFNKHFIFVNDFTIKSGSIAQIYKIKCTNDLYYNDIQFLKDNEYALKIVHPELKYQVYFFIKIINLHKYLVNNISYFKKYSLFFDLDNFIKNLLLQFDMINEFKNMKYFYQEYYNNDKIIIPKPFISYKKFLIMEYVNGTYFHDLNVNTIKKQEIYCLLNLFFRDNVYHKDLVHGDLHPYNWKIINPESDYKIVIYDYGYIVKIINKQSIINFSYYHIINNTYKSGEIFYNYLINKNLSLQDFNDMLKNYLEKKCREIIPFSNELIFDIFNFIYSNNFKVHAEFFDFIIITLLQKNYISKYISYNKIKYNSLYEYNITVNSIILNYNMCKKYNIFPKLIQYFENLLNDINIKSCYKYKNNYLDNTIHNNTIDNNIDI